MKIARVAAVLALTGALAVPAVQAQQGPPPGRRGPAMTGPRHGPHPGQGIRVILDHREELELNEDQVADLEALAAEIRQAHQTHVQQLRDVREELERNRAALRERMLELTHEMREAGMPHRERVESILSPEQLERLPELRPRRKAGPRGGVMRPRMNRRLRGGEPMLD